MTCEKCSVLCITCKNGNKNNICTTCKGNFTLKDGKCFAKCHSGFHKEGHECMRNCSIGYYLIRNMCHRCPINCLMCTSTELETPRCILCKPPKVLDSNGTCVDHCKLPLVSFPLRIQEIVKNLKVRLVGGYTKGNVEMLIDTTWTPVCLHDYNTYGHNAEVICRELLLGRPSYYRSSSVVAGFATNISQHVNILVCSGTAQSTSQCDSISVKKGECPHHAYFYVECAGSEHRMCKNRCNSGQFQVRHSSHGSDYFVCETCGTSCKACSSHSTACTSCIKNLLLHRDRCGKSCPSGYYENYTKRVCSTCNNYCAMCRTSPSRCISCNKPYYLQNMTCVASCRPQFKVKYADEVLFRGLKLVKDQGGTFRLMVSRLSLLHTFKECHHN